MAYYKVTLNQGRTDTVLVEADSLTNVKTFFETVSTANITIIKKVIFSKDLGIGSVVTTYTPNNQFKYLKALVKTKKGYSSTISLSFPMKNLTQEKIIKSIKKNLLLKSDEITEIINIIIDK